MSEQNRDTSRPYNKNPLLSASVTGLTFDDFTNKAIILPAASIPPQDVSKDVKDIEKRKPAIFGSEPAILDTENFSEISLDQSSEVEPFPSAANTLLEDQFNGENAKIFNPLTQTTHLTASLSQLPSVASSVFSSFSSILRGSSPTSYTEQQSQIEPYVTLSAQPLSEVPFINSGQSYQSEEPVTPVVAPTFYSTNDPLFLPPSPALSPPPSNTSSGNAYRLTTKRKTYAPAPGLSHQDHSIIPTNLPQIQPLPQPITEPKSQDIQRAGYADSSVNQTSSSQGNKFSLTSFFASPLLEKIKGSSGSQIQEPQDISEVYTTVESTNLPPPPVNFVNPGIFNTNPLTAENLLSFPSEQQRSQPTPALAAPIFLNPAQEKSTISGSSYQHRSNLCGPIDTVPNILPAAPISVLPPGPTSSNVSNYRLRGKPHYKNPLSSATVSTSLVVPYLPVTANVAPPIDIFNPGHTEANSTESTLSTGLSQQLLSTATLFNRPIDQSISSIDQHSSYLISDNSSKTSFANGAPIKYFDPFGSPSELEASADQLPERDRTLPNQEQPSQVQFLVQATQPSEHRSAVEQLQPTSQIQQTLQSQQPIQLQQTGQLQETGQLQQLFQFQRKSSEQFQESSLLQQPTLPQHLPLQVQETVIQTPSYPSPFQQQSPYPSNTESQGSCQVTQTNLHSNVLIGFANQSQHHATCPNQTSSQSSSEFKQYSQENFQKTIIQPELTEQNFDKIQIENLSLNNQQTDSNWNYNFRQSLQDDTNLIESNEKESVTNIESSNPAFDNFFNQNVQSQQRETCATSQHQPHSTPILASTFFSNSSNLSHPDWFNPSRTLDSSTNESQAQSDINSNIEISSTTTIDASNFFTADNNLTSINSSQPNYFQIQNFFNNPPLIADSKEQDNNFNFIENNLINKRLHNLTHKASTETDGGSISSNLSNIVEPPSSAQSELSEFAENNPETTVQSNDSLVEQEFTVDQSILTTNMADKTNQSNGSRTISSDTNNDIAYRPIYRHWFYKKIISDRKPTWTPFSSNDSFKLEEAFNTKSTEFVSTNGGRFDVDLEARVRHPVYWNGISEEVRRCAWFYKGADSRLIPYDEDVSDMLEEEYKKASEIDKWNRKITISTGEVVILQSPTTIVHFLAASTSDLAPSTTMPQTSTRPRAVKRGVDEFDIEEGEPDKVDHLIFVVHGIGSGCDLRFRCVEEVVEDFRAISLQMIQSHYLSSCDRGEVGRIEILPVSWHAELHSEDTGIDEKLKAITLQSIPKLRKFTNGTLLDILFYSSPVFCQKIMDTVSGTINNMYIKYCKRHPNFNGNVSLAGHSLGSLILFDLLQHQKNSQSCDNKDSLVFKAESCSDGVVTQKEINYTVGTAGTGQPFINYPQLEFYPKKFFALGSPIGMFITIRGVETLGLNYKLPTTDGFYNIFHPYDPVAYRIEPLINSELVPSRPVLIPHHKGRKRMHLELREKITRVSAEIKQKIIDTFKSVYNFASLQKNDPKLFAEEVDQVIEQQLALDSSNSQRIRANSTSTSSSDDNGETEFSLGILNEGRRIDYVLQEAPLEFFNEYLFALTSHVCYWDSADTILFLIKEIYCSQGIHSDRRIPQQSMTIERPTSMSPPPPMDL